MPRDLTEDERMSLEAFFAAKDVYRAARRKYAADQQRCVKVLRTTLHSSTRDIAWLMGISHQRVSQILTDEGS
jgi:DNA-directed RNA polymerase specialized sigma subunit